MLPSYPVFPIHSLKPEPRKLRVRTAGILGLCRVLGDDAPEDQKVDFIDGLTQSLQRGAFLLLIAGDGIRPALQQIADLLNRSLAFTLGLVEFAIYSGDGDTGPFYVQPRILFRTETVTRTVFVLADRQGKLAIENVTEPTRAKTRPRS